MTGTGISNSVAERALSLAIQAKDKDGASRNDGGDDFKVHFEIDGHNTDVAVVDHGILLFLYFIKKAILL